MEIIVKTSIYNIDNPAGFDLEIGHMQTLLSKLTFMDTIYGRAHLQEEHRSVKEVENMKLTQPALKRTDLYMRRYPQGRKFDQDIDLTFSDQYKSMGFFYVPDPVGATPINKKDWTVYEGQIRLSQSFSFMFFADLRKLNTTSGEYLKIAILAQLNKMNNLVLGNLFESYDLVLKDFTVTDNLIQYCRYPYYALRIDGVSTFPIFPENGNGVFDPAKLTDNSREAVSPPGVTNIN